MELSLLHSCPSTATQVFVLSGLLWPFLAAALLKRRATSAGPIAAVLVPIAFSVCNMWIGLYNGMRGLSLSGAGWPSVAAAGFAEAFSVLRTGAIFAALVLAAAAIRRHRPFVDRMTASLFVVLVVEVAGALVITNSFGPWWHHHIVWGAITAGAVAFIAAVWTIFTGRGRIATKPLPFGIPVMTACCIVIGVVVWLSARHYLSIAGFGP